MAIIERKQLTGSTAKINQYAGHEGQLVFDKTTKHLHVLSGTAGTSTKLANVSDIPAPVDISGKADTSYVETELGKKANKTHTHAVAGVTGLQTALDGKATTKALTDGLAGKADSVHTHEIANVNGLQTALDAKADSSALTNFIPKASSRGELAGYETPLVQATALTINGASRDSNLVTGAVAITVSNGATSQSWTKTVALSNASATISLGSNWKWVGGKAPSVSANCVVVLHWCNNFGIANLAATS